MQGKVVGEIEDEHYLERDFQEQYHFALCPGLARSSFW